LDAVNKEKRRAKEDNGVLQVKLQLKRGG
jgi:HSP20 family molecular chaperone IbpA